MELFTKQIIHPSKCASMLALNWKEPYASLMLYAGKRETRTWVTNVKGWHLLCSSRAPFSQRQLQVIAGPEQSVRIQEAINYHRIDYKLTLGHAIAVAYLNGVRRMQEDDEDVTFVKYRKELYVWEHEEIRPIVPFPWHGVQGWKAVPKEIIQQIQYL